MDGLMFLVLMYILIVVWIVAGCLMIWGLLNSPHYPDDYDLEDEEEIDDRDDIE
jgi:hypothetical protein